MTDLVCDPAIEICNEPSSSSASDLELHEVGSESLTWLIVLYYFQVLLMPFLGLSVSFRDVWIFNAWYWSPMMWLHTFAYLPTASVSTLYFIFGRRGGSFANLVDDTAIAMIVYLSANLGVAIHTTGFLIFLAYAIFQSDSLAYWSLLALYTLFSLYTEFFYITEGVEAIRYIQPKWKGTKSGLIFPMLLYMIGLVNKDEQPQWFAEETPDQTGETSSLLLTL